MATKSFTREIRITEPAAVKKIDAAMKVNSTDKYRTSIRNINELQTASRKSLASRITKKY
jgi:hypothetical protein